MPADEPEAVAALRLAVAAVGAQPAPFCVHLDGAGARQVLDHLSELHTRIAQLTVERDLAIDALAHHRPLEP